MAGADVAVHADQVPRFGQVEGLRVREDTLFTGAQGQEKRAIRKFAEKALNRLHEPLQRLLATDEAILYVARALAPVSVLEQMTVGWSIYRYMATTLVLTNKRLLHFTVNPNGAWKRGLRAVAWGDLAQGKITGGILGRALLLTYRNGKRDKYWGLQSRDVKKLRALLNVLHSSSMGQGTGAESMTPLCPSCLNPLQPGNYACGRCGQGFKTEASLKKRLLIPGRGYFYIGWGFLGVMTFIFESILLLEVAVLLIGLAALLATPSRPVAPNPNGSELAVTLGFFALLIVLEKTLALYHCRRAVREFIPVAGAGNLAPLGSIS